MSLNFPSEAKSSTNKMFILWYFLQKLLQIHFLLIILPSGIAFCPKTTTSFDRLDCTSNPFNTRSKSGWKSLFAAISQGRGGEDTTIQSRPPPSSKHSKVITVGERIGSGSYGTVHFLTVQDEITATDPKNNNHNTTIMVGKRPWLQEELLDQPQTVIHKGNKGKAKNMGSSSSGSSTKGLPSAKDRAVRCRYYWEVEAHCFTKLPRHPQLPPYFGTLDDTWMMFGLVGDEQQQRPAPTLADLMKLDCDHPQSLKNIGAALGTHSFEETMDRILESLLTVLAHVHDNKIVHRDVKPSNLLVHEGRLLLMDFGSAADLEPERNGLIQRYRGLESGNRVAVSPIYCAPEIFIDRQYHPLAFDVFSTGLLVCQVLFAYLEERIDAGNSPIPERRSPISKIPNSSA